MRTKSTDELANALKLLESASRHKRDELRNAINGKYENLKELLQEREGGFLRSWANTRDKAMEAAARLEESGRRHAREAGREVERTVRGHPWYAIAGTAVAGLVLGCVLRGSARE